MERIGFPQYASGLLEYGWDDLEFLSDLTESDLTEAGVPKEHQRMVRLCATQFMYQNVLLNRQAHWWQVVSIQCINRLII